MLQVEMATVGQLSSGQNRQPPTANPTRFRQPSRLSQLPMTDQLRQQTPSQTNNQLPIGDRLRQQTSSQFNQLPMGDNYPVLSYQPTQLSQSMQSIQSSQSKVVIFITNMHDCLECNLADLPRDPNISLNSNLFHRDTLSV